MTSKEIEIHAGHWKALNSGATGIISEVAEARRVAKRVYEILKIHKVPVTYFEDNVSTSQQQNLTTLVKHHNADRDGLIISIHFNSSGEIIDSGLGTEVLYFDEKELAVKLANAISKASGLICRGVKQRTDLAVLANTFEPALLIEVCFVNSKEDVKLYKEQFEKLCFAIAQTLMTHMGYKINPDQTDKNNTKDDKDVSMKFLNETGRKEARELIRRAVKEGVFSASHHTEERIEKYTDGELVSYQIAYVNRTLKKE